MAEDKHPSIGALGERDDRVTAQVRVDGDCTGAPHVECGSSVRGCRRTDVASLGVEDHRDFRSNVLDRPPQRLKSLQAIGFVKRVIGLVRAHQVSRGVHDSPIEGKNGIVLGLYVV